jgi:SAM-dependent methyltransferase
MRYEFIDPEEQLTSTEFQVIESFLRQTNRTQIGWHYFTDLIWIYRKIKDLPKGSIILDAGGGTGPTQFLLLEIGFNVVNVDLLLQEPSISFRKRYRCKINTVQGQRPTNYSTFIFSKNRRLWKNLYRKSPLYGLMQFMTSKPEKYADACDNWRIANGMNAPVGDLSWVPGNLCSIPEIENNHFDAVVSLSALEHIDREQLQTAIDEIKRVAKPEAFWALTTSGTDRSTSWFHYPSKGWCFSAKDIEHYFDAQYRGKNPKHVLNQYHKCEYLKNNLASFYKKSEHYGMPWGEWNPKYIPVGISNR